MPREITTLDNSKYKKDYNKYFTIGDYHKDTHEIGNKEWSEEVFKKIFDTINSIIIIYPNKDGRIDGNLSYMLDEDSSSSKAKIAELLRTEKLTFHSREFHEDASIRADCKQAIHFFDFNNYAEIVKFLEWDELEVDADLRVYTTLKGSIEESESLVVKNKDKRVHKSDESTRPMTTTDTVRVESPSQSKFGRSKLIVHDENVKSRWSNIVDFFARLFGTAD